MSAASKRTVLNPFAGPSDIPKSARLRAWWNGVDPASSAQGPADAIALQEVTEPEAELAENDDTWTRAEMEVAQMVFGKGFVEPGGPEFLLELVKPFALSPAMSILNMTAGLGGSSRAIVEELGAWVDGMESSKVLAAEGMEQSKMAGLGKKAPIVHFDPENLELRSKKYDCVFARELLYTVEDKESFFRRVVESLKDIGQFQFTDFMLRETGLESDAVSDWLRYEPSRTFLWSAEDYRRLCHELNLEVRISKDIGNAYSGHVSAGVGRVHLAGARRRHGSQHRTHSGRPGGNLDTAGRRHQERRHSAHTLSHARASLQHRLMRRLRWPPDLADPAPSANSISRLPRPKRYG